MSLMIRRCLFFKLYLIILFCPYPVVLLLRRTRPVLCMKTPRPPPTHPLSPRISMLDQRAVIWSTSKGTPTEKASAREQRRHTGGAGDESARIRAGAKEERGRGAGGGPSRGEQPQSENTTYTRVESNIYNAIYLEHTNVIKRPSPANRQSAPRLLGQKV